MTDGVHKMYDPNIFQKCARRMAGHTFRHSVGTALIALHVQQPLVHNFWFYGMKITTYILYLCTINGDVRDCPQGSKPPCTTSGRARPRRPLALVS